MNQILRARDELEKQLFQLDDDTNCASYQGLVLQSAYQPIFDSSGDVFAYEALLRLHTEKEQKIDTASLIRSYHSQPHHLINLDRLARVIHLRNFARFLSRSNLFINMCPVAMVDGESQALTRKLMLPRLQELGILPQQVYVEILEHFYHDPKRLAECTELLKSCNLNIAMDDYGIKGSSEQRARLVAPDVMKIDRSLLVMYMRGNKQPIHRAISVAKDLKAKVLIEGIECQACLQVANELGADYYQGYFVGRPRYISSIVRGDVSDNWAKAEYNSAQSTIGS
ncbi:EAL domain-containing protein [Photobacterium sanctipauli]|uniref:EAL domain-containing protein n=1 Tax=Photobacterium sanctipauli TaxID=1342794 RepID=A0A2T3NU33_9GAMM|nr:EAL domain-containing protein [Photobacterium sanctipauli]PSW19796.1 EAL domain-containing protein [Photobacterium sanctipauli]